jgi:hypothetical protein
MPLTPEQQQLRDAAKQATPGPWHAGSFDRNGAKPTVYAADTELRYVAQCVDFLNVTPTPNEANARFIAAANPAAILALLDQLEAQEAPAPRPHQCPKQTPYGEATCGACLEAQETTNTDKLLNIIASVYQIAGAHDAPAHILDVLADPEAATVEQVEAMLPYRAGRVVADGCVVVPVEPTEDMVIAGFESVPDRVFDGASYPGEYDQMSGCQQAAFRARRCYAAMLAASALPGDPQ